MEQNFFKEELLIHYNSIRNYLLSYLHDNEIASDLAQDCVIQAYELFLKDKYQEKKALKNWLFCMAYSRLMDYYRQQSSHKSRLQEHTQTIRNNMGWNEDDVCYQFELQTESKTESYFKFAKRMLESSFENVPLSVSQRRVMQLRYIKHLPYKEIASLLHEPISTVISRHVYSMKLIRGIYAQESAKKAKTSYR